MVPSCSFGEAISEQDIEKKNDAEIVAFYELLTDPVPQAGG